MSFKGWSFIYDALLLEWMRIFHECNSRGSGLRKRLWAGDRLWPTKQVSPRLGLLLIAINELVVVLRDALAKFGSDCCKLWKNCLAQRLYQKKPNWFLILRVLLIFCFWQSSWSFYAFDLQFNSKYSHLSKYSSCVPYFSQFINRSLLFLWISAFLCWTVHINKRIVAKTWIKVLTPENILEISSWIMHMVGRMLANILCWFRAAPNRVLKQPTIIEN